MPEMAPKADEILVVDQYVENFVDGESHASNPSAGVKDENPPKS